MTAVVTAPIIPPRVDALARLRSDVAALCAFPRPSASEGEHRAAGMIAGWLGELGAHARVQDAPAHGTYHQPLGLMAACGLASAMIAGLGRGGRAAGAALGAAAAAGVYSDITGGRHHARRLLRRRRTHNVIATLGPPDAQRAVVLVAHHDAARSGAIFDPRIARLLRDTLPAASRDEKSSPPAMWPVLGGPAIAAAGALTGSRAVRAAGAALSAGTLAAMADIAARGTVEGANDNATGVACLVEVARRLASSPTGSVRVMIVSTGCEESLMEGMKAFADRHLRSRRRADTFVLCVDTVGSERLCSLQAEGMVRLRRYPRRAVAALHAAADRAGVHVEPGVKLRNATDGLYALRLGLPCASLGSYAPHIGAPANYHWPTDTPDRVRYQSVLDAADVCERLVRDLDSDWRLPALADCP